MNPSEQSLEFKKEAGPVTDVPEIDIDFPDDKITELIDRKVKEYTDFYASKDVAKRSERLVNYYRGNQSRDPSKELDSAGYINNVIYRDLNTRAQNATSKMPDIVATSPQMQDDLQVRESSQKVEQWLSIRLDSDVLRRLAKRAVIDNHLKFRAVWKYRYDHFRKDAIIEAIKPENVVLDSSAQIPDDGFTCDNMEFIGEWIELPTAVVLAMFPEKEVELLAELDKEMADKRETARSSKVRFLQCWMTFHDRHGSPKELLVNKYNQIILSKGPNPYWDEREGTDMSFGMEQIDPMAAMDQQPGMPEKPKRKNFFEFARKPYTVFAGLSFGDGPLDATTVVEVALPMQDIVNKRGNQISLINDWAVPKMITSSNFMTEEKAANITRDPSEIIVLSDAVEDVRSALVPVIGAPASPALYKDLQDSISAIDALFSTNPISRGETVSPESGVSKQISREGDLASADDIAQTMVQRGVEEAANWLVQLAKIYFDEPRTATKPGPDRSVLSSQVSSGMIPDDLQIVVKANAIDKPTRRDLDLHLASMKAIDPYTLFQDLEYSNPKEMAKRLVDFLNGAPNGFAQYLDDLGINPTQPAGSVPEGEPGPAGPAAPGAMPQPMPPGQQPPPGPQPPVLINQ